MRRDSWWQESLDRTALVLKLQQIEKTGAIAAAGTTSLPAIIHGAEAYSTYRRAPFPSDVAAAR